MTLYLVTFTDTIVRACVVEAGSEDDAVHVASRTPWEAWREAHREQPTVTAQALDGVRPESQP